MVESQWQVPHLLRRTGKAGSGAGFVLTCFIALSESRLSDGSRGWVHLFLDCWIALTCIIRVWFIWIVLCLTGFWSNCQRLRVPFQFLSFDMTIVSFWIALKCIRLVYTVLCVWQVFEGFFRGWVSFGMFPSEFTTCFLECFHLSSLCVLNHLLDCTALTWQVHAALASKALSLISSWHGPNHRKYTIYSWNSHSALHIPQTCIFPVTWLDGSKSKTSMNSCV